MKSSKPMKVLITVLVFVVSLLSADGGVSAENKLVVAVGQPLPNTLIEAFKHEYPDVELELLVYPSWTFNEKLTLLFLTGERIDVLFGWSVYNWADYALNGQLLDLAVFAEKDQAWIEENEIDPFVFEAGYIGGKMAGINFEQRTGWVVFYNDILLQEAGLPRPSATWDNSSWTWETFCQYVEKIGEVDASGLPIQYGIGHHDDDLTIFNLAWMWGTDVLDSSAYEMGVAQRVYLTQPEMSEAFEALLALEAKGVNSGQKDSFLNGNCGMWIGVGDFYDYGFPWGVTRSPIGPGGSVPLGTWSSFVGIPFSAEQPELAWEFIKFLLTEGNVLHNDDGGWWRGGATRESWQVRFDTVANSILRTDELLDFYLAGLDGHTRIGPAWIIAGAGAVRNNVWQQLRLYTGKAKENIRVSEALMVAEQAINIQLQEETGRYFDK